MTDHDAMIAACRAAPEDDTPRLAFADWLTEQGLDERGELIRVACELAKELRTEQTKAVRSVSLTEYQNRLVERKNELLQQHETTWLNPSVLWSIGWQANSTWTWRRGFVAECRTAMRYWCGGPCDRCDGTGWERVADAAGDMDDQGCRDCSRSINVKGTGRTPAFGPHVVRDPNCVIERVVLADRGPFEYHSTAYRKVVWTWFHRDPGDGLDVDDPAVLPSKLFDRLGKKGLVDVDSTTERFRSNEFALSALSAAAIAWALATEPEELPT